MQILSSIFKPVSNKLSFSALGYDRTKYGFDDELKPKIDIDDENCFDEFYRTDELFDPNKDYADISYQRYSYDDILPCDKTSDIYVSVQNYSCENKANPIESSFPPHVVLKRNNKKIYLENLYDFTDSHSWSNAFLRDCIESMEFDIGDVVNIVDASCFGNFSTFNQNFARIGLNLLRQNYPLDTVLKYIEDAKLYVPDIGKKGSIPLLKFLIDFPDNRSDFVVKSRKTKEEIFDSNGADLYKTLYNICDKPEDALEAVKYSRSYDPLLCATLTDNHLANLSLLMCQKHKKLSDLDKKVLDLVDDKSHLYYEILHMLQNNVSSQYICDFYKND